MPSGSPSASANLASLLHAQAAARPDHPALLTPSQPPITFAMLQSAVLQAATLLERAGLVAGDRVLVYQPISAALYIALGALFHAGLTVVFIDPGMDRTQLERAAALLAPRGFLATPRAHLLRLLSPTIRRIPIRFTTGDWPLPGASRWSDATRLPATSAPPIHACDDETPALITVTSGSTGTPKFATRTHAFLRRQHQAIESSLSMAADTTVLSTLPIFILSFLASGLTTLLPNVDLRRPGQVNSARLLAQMQEAGVNTIAASPALLDQVARACITEKITLPHIRQVYSGGAPIFVDLMDQTVAAMPQASFHAVYGATEAEPIATLDYATLTATDRQHMAQGAGLLVGTPVPSLEVCVIPDQWGEPHGPYSSQAWANVQLSAARGEIVVRGPHVLTSVGPEEDPALTKIQVDSEIWHRTGDAGYWDQTGRLWLLGRCAARIDTIRADGSQERLYPFVVESAAHTFAAVKHAALVGLQRRRVLTLELYSPQDVRWLAAIHETLSWAELDEIRILDKMPVDRRHNAKIDYPALRRLLDK
jgi:acyl-CoA synthetase (AMP-forming)/AMP-acid ligase II